MITLLHFAIPNKGNTSLVSLRHKTHLCAEINFLSESAVSLFQFGFISRPDSDFVYVELKGHKTVEGTDLVVPSNTSI
jgi:hypothetical protein